jgi:ABC-2 type transport system ATP-binding protein
MTTSLSADPAVEIVGLTKQFKQQVAVRELNLTIPKGTTFGFLGPNGAGKTTTLKMLMGLLRRDAGRVSVLGLDPARDALEIRRRVGYVPEQQFIYRWMRVDEAVGFCRRIYPTWNESTCSDLLKVFGLSPEKKVKHLSKGMAVKLSLLIALSHEPELLILDEPMAGLDPLVREELLEGVLRTSADRGHAIVFSSHTFDDVQRMADVVGILHEGQLLVHRRVDELLRKTKRIRAVLQNGATGKAPEGTVWQRVKNREWLLTVGDYSDDTVPRLQAVNTLQSVEVVDLGLEEIFKDYVRGWRMPA